MNMLTLYLEYNNTLSILETLE